MNRIMTAVATLSITLPLALTAQPMTQSTEQLTKLSKQELRSMMQNAHDTTQYKQLADYYHQQEANYRAQANAELMERDRRAQYTMGTAQKYPRPVDSAEYLYESYVSQADDAAAKAKHYDDLAAASQGKS